MPHRGERRFALVLILPAILIVFGIVLYPLVQTFIYSLQDMRLTSDTKGEFVGLANYAIMFGDGEFWASVFRTFYFSIVTVIAETMLGLMIALLLNENFRGRKFLQTIIIIPWAIPTIVNAAMWKSIYHAEYGALNALLTQLGIIGEYQSWLSTPWTAIHMVMIADIWKMTPLAVIFFLSALQLVNKSVYEAAMVDGAGMFRRLFTLTLPFLKPTILVVIVMRTMDSFKVFDLIYALTQGGPANGTMVLTYKAYLSAFNNMDYSQGSSISYFIGCMIAILTLLYVRLLKREEA